MASGSGSQATDKSLPGRAGTWGGPEGKEGKNEKRKIPNLTLSPKRHKVLKEDSVVSSNPIVATKDKSGTYKPIYGWEFEETKDKLTVEEHRHIMQNLGAGIEKHKKTSMKLLSDWKNHFSNK